MDALTPLLEAGATLGLVVAIIFQATKPFAEAWLVKPANTLHDPTLRVLLFVVALILSALSTLAGLTPGMRLDGAAVWTICKTAGGAWLVALVVYHALQGDILGSQTAGPASIPQFSLGSFSASGTVAEAAPVPKSAPTTTPAPTVAPVVTPAPATTPSPVLAPPAAPVSPAPPAESAT